MGVSSRQKAHHRIKFDAEESTRLDCILHAVELLRLDHLTPWTERHVRVHGKRAALSGRNIGHDPDLIVERGDVFEVVQPITVIDQRRCKKAYVGSVALRQRRERIRQFCSRLRQQGR